MVLILYFKLKQVIDLINKKDCLFRSFVIDFGIDQTETEAVHAAGIQGPGLKDGSFGSSWSGN